MAAALACGLNAAAVRALHAPDKRARLAREGAAPGSTGRAIFPRLVMTEMGKWARDVGRSGSRVASTQLMPVLGRCSRNRNDDPVGSWVSRPSIPFRPTHPQKPLWPTRRGAFRVSRPQRQDCRRGTRPRHPKNPRLRDQTDLLHQRPHLLARRRAVQTRTRLRQGRHLLPVDPRQTRMQSRRRLRRVAQLPLQQLAPRLQRHQPTDLSPFSLPLMARDRAVGAPISRWPRPCGRTTR